MWTGRLHQEGEWVSRRKEPEDARERRPLELLLDSPWMSSSIVHQC